MTPEQKAFGMKWESFYRSFPRETAWPEMADFIKAALEEIDRLREQLAGADLNLHRRLEECGTVIQNLRSSAEAKDKKIAALRETLRAICGATVANDSVINRLYRISETARDALKAAGETE